jgi:hypothetical protein
MASSPAARAAEDGPRLVEVGVTVTQDQIESQSLAFDEIRRQGMLVFSTPFNKQDGLGDGPRDPADPLSPGGRGSLQGNGTFLRVNGLDAQSCLECHSIVSNLSVPPRFGVGGVGGSSSNAIVQPSFIDVIDPATGFDGRFINPPFLFGSGGVQLLANEMTEDLQALAAWAEEHPGTDVELVTKGVHFGTLRFESGAFDVSGVEGIDTDLVVRPFGRKGEFATVRGFDLGAMEFHFGMQPVENENVGPGVDADGDGVADEIEPGEMSALEIFSTNLERPRRVIPNGRTQDDVQAGERRFREMGCADCHVPMLTTRGRHLGYRLPEVEYDPSANVFYSVDLSRTSAGFDRTRSGGIEVPLFADLKRHDMGPELAESFGSDLDPFFTTARLWGVADTAPYLHDGRATTLEEAILLHGGEAADARDAFASASPGERAQVLWFLRSLRTPQDPAADLQPRSPSWTRGFEAPKP